MICFSVIVRRDQQMCNVLHAQTLYVTADILSGSGAEHSSEMKFGQSAHRTQRVGIQYLRQMTVDVHYYVLNHLMMKAACLLLLPPSVQCGKAFVQYLPQLFRRIVRVCVFIIFICIFYRCRSFPTWIYQQCISHPSGSNNKTHHSSNRQSWCLNIPPRRSGAAFRSFGNIFYLFLIQPFD